MGKHPLKHLGWSQENIAKVIGCSRPTLKKHLEGHTALTIEQAVKLETLTGLNMSYDNFVSQAFEKYAYQIVSRPSYQKLADKGEL